MTREPGQRDGVRGERRDAEGGSEPAEKRVKEVSAQLNAVAYAVIGAAIAVHRELGPGLPEAVYEEALALELRERGIPFERQSSVVVLYRGKAVGKARMDMLVDGELVLELKAVEELRPVHRAQLKSYLCAGGFELGLLINFNVTVLSDGVSRVINTQPFLCGL